MVCTVQFLKKTVINAVLNWVSVCEMKACFDHWSFDRIFFFCWLVHPQFNFVRLLSRTQLIEPVVIKRSVVSSGVIYDDFNPVPMARVLLNLYLVFVQRQNLTKCDKFCPVLSHCHLSDCFVKRCSKTLIEVSLPCLRFAIPSLVIQVCSEVSSIDVFQDNKMSWIL